MPAMGPPERVALLAKGLSMARAEVAEHYDEVFYEVVERIDARGSVGKGDIAMLTVWKRLRANTTWVKQLLAKSESTVRKLTAPAVRAARTGEVVEAAGKARDHLWSLPGFVYGTALASALGTTERPVAVPAGSARPVAPLGVPMRPDDQARGMALARASAGAGQVDTASSPGRPVPPSPAPTRVPGIIKAHGVRSIPV